VVSAEDHDRLVADLHAALAKSEQAQKDAQSRHQESIKLYESLQREMRRVARELIAEHTRERDARVSVEALRGLMQRYAGLTISHPHLTGWLTELDKLCAAAGAPPADDELTRVTRQRDALQGELERLKAEHAGHDLIVTEALRVAQEQIDALTARLTEREQQIALLTEA
jgi:hypothetical protein